MKLDHEFYKLPLCFDVDQLRKELACFAEQDWQKHPSDYEGNLAIPLISVNGGINDDFVGPMKITRFLEQSPYLQQVIASFNSVCSRSRLMRLEGMHEVPLHSDINAHWWPRVRIHVPVITTPDVVFHCGDQKVHMAQGEAWIFDAWKMHKVVNSSGNTRVHLVIDTAGSPEFWELVEKAQIYSSPSTDGVDKVPDLIPFQRTHKAKILTEKFNASVVMAAGEVDALVDGILQDVYATKGNSESSLCEFTRIVKYFSRKWRSVWSLHGTERTGWVDYESLTAGTCKRLLEIDSPLLTNQSVAAEVMIGRVITPAFNPNLDAFYNPVLHKDVQSGIAGDSGGISHEKTGRNSPCPCGSGKKYKRCHGS